MNQPLTTSDDEYVFDIGEAAPGRVDILIGSVNSFVVRPLTGERVAWKGPSGYTDARGKRYASKSDTLRGVKPADNIPTSLSRTKTRATPAGYADERNRALFNV
jgi:hypothetical protein